MTSDQEEPTVTATATATATSDWDSSTTDATTEREPTSTSDSTEETTLSWSKPATTEETQTTKEEASSSSSEFDNSHLSSYLSSIIYTDSTAANQQQQQQTASDAMTTTAVDDIPTTDATSAPTAAAAATSSSLDAIANIVSQTAAMSSSEEQAKPATTEAIAETSLDTTPTKSSSSIYYPSSTRSFSVTSSTATPMLVLGSSTECTDDPHAVDGKCTYEYFCNAATHSCVFLLEDNSACYEDFQCASTYCTNHICVAAPESKPSGQGGKIAGSIIGSVAGAAVLLFGLIRWRKRSQVINRRMNRFQSNNHSNEKPAFYDATTTILPASHTNHHQHDGNTNQGNARLSKYNFLAHMLNPEPPMTEPQQHHHYASNADHFTIPVAATERGAALAKQVDYNPFRAAMTDSPDPWAQEDYQSLKKPENKTVYSYI